MPGCTLHICGFLTDECWFVDKGQQVECLLAHSVVLVLVRQGVGVGVGEMAQL